MLECREYRKKPVVIEAIRYSGDNLAEVLAFTGKHPRFDEWFSSFDDYAAHVASDRRVFKILTLEGTMEASPGDWIIKGVKGEIYPCKSDIFALTYEPVLSTVTPAEVAGLVGRLQERATVMEALSPDFASACRESASLIQSQAARIVELEAAIRGLLDCPDIADNDYKDEETHAAERAARRALEGGREDGNG